MRRDSGMSQDEQRNRATFAARQTRASAPTADAERKEHAEERELPPGEPVKPVENPAGLPTEVPEGPGPRHGDQR